MLDPRDSSIVHTLAELKRQRANRATHKLEREKYRNESRAFLTPLLSGDNQSARYARVTLVKVALDELRDVLADSSSSDKEVDESVRVVESHLERAQQQFPDEQFLHTAEADFGTLLQDDARSIAALKRAFGANPRDPYIASRFAKVIESRGDFENARDILGKAIDANRGDKQLNYLYANVMRRSGVTDLALLLYHYHRAFSRWDTNYEAQFWFARFAFESLVERERIESKETFQHLRDVPLAHEVRVQIRDVIGGSTSPRVHFGLIVRREVGYGFIERDGSGDWIFCHKRLQSDWDSLFLGQRVQFSIGFSFGGAVALDIMKV